MNINLLESPVDERNYVYGNICNGVVELPNKYLVDTGEVRNQMGTNHCASYSSIYCQTADIKEKFGEDLLLSPMFTHMNGKKIDKNNRATGCALSDIMKSINTYGCALEKDYPSINLLTNDFPKCSDEVYKKALKYKSDGYARVSLDVDSIKRAIYDNNGCVSHIRIFNNYFNDCWIPKPPLDKEPNGSHAIAIVGWDDTLTHTYENGNTYKGYFILRESYGMATRTNKSYLYLPYVAIDEGWRGKYSVDTLVKEVWTTYNKGKVALPNYYQTNQDTNNLAFKPNKVIEMTLNSDKCIVNGNEITMDVIPQVVNGVTFVPLSFISNMLGHTVRWYGERKEVFIFAKKLNKNIYMWIGNCKAKNGKEDYYFILPPQIINGRTMIPIRSVEMLSVLVDYNPTTKKITLIEQ